VVRPGKVEVEEIDSKSKVEVVQSSKFEVKDINKKFKSSTDKRSTSKHVEID
jgi:hypothetical protein